MINNAKYGGKSILPELRVIDSGLLKGFVTISPKWAGFKAADYLQASMSVYTDEDYYGQSTDGEATFEVAAGDFDLRGFEVTNAALFDTNKRPYACFKIRRSSSVQVVFAGLEKTLPSKSLHWFPVPAKHLFGA